METITKEYKVFNYDELSDTAKEKALNQYNESNDFNFLSDDLNELLKEILATNKIYSINDDYRLFYSLNYSQGDGACFIGRFKWKNYYITIKHIGHYYHEKSTNIYIETNAGNEAKSSVYAEFEELYLNICLSIKKSGYSIIEAESSEENFKDLCSMNEYKFLENGKMF